MEYIIENVTEEEIKKLEATDINWYPDDLEGSDIVIEGDEKKCNRALQVIGRDERS